MVPLDEEGSQNCCDQQQPHQRQLLLSLRRQLEQTLRDVGTARMCGASVGAAYNSTLK